MISRKWAIGILVVVGALAFAHGFSSWKPKKVPDEKFPEWEETLKICEGELQLLNERMLVMWCKPDENGFQRRLWIKSKGKIEIYHSKDVGKREE